jgi:DNA-binding PadR family transcriptional regulator
MLELAILGLLKDQDLHGYELKKRLSDMLGFVTVSFGSLYPALGRLERVGAVRAVAAEPKRPAIASTGSLTGDFALLRAGIGGRGRSGLGAPDARRGGRSRKVYSITNRGHELFAELLAAESQSSEDDRAFSLRLAFARYLPHDARLGLLERRRAHLLERRSALRRRISRRDRLDAYASSLIEHDRETTEHDLSWIERLIATERSAPDASPDGGPVPAATRAAVFSMPNPWAAAPTVSGLRPPVTEEDLTP